MPRSSSPISATKNFKVFPLKHRYLDIIRMLPAQLRRATGEIAIPPEAEGGDYDLVVIGSPTWWLTTCMPIRSYLKSDEAGQLLKGKSVAGFVVCRRYWKNNLKTVKQLSETHGATIVGETHFAYLGGQVRSLLSLISYLGTGEYHERYLGIKIPPTNLQPDGDDEARAFAGELADKFGAAGSSAGAHEATRVRRRVSLASLGAGRVRRVGAARGRGDVRSRSGVWSRSRWRRSAIPGTRRSEWCRRSRRREPRAQASLPDGTGIYPTCADAPSDAPSCLTVGGVKNTYGIGEFEITVSQYVTFLNTVDPAGKNLRQLYDDNMNPRSGRSTARSTTPPSAAAGKHYSVAYPEWADKPFNFGDFRRGAQFVNSLFNGKVLSKATSTEGPSTTSPTRCGSRRRPSRACTT